MAMLDTSSSTRHPNKNKDHTDDDEGWCDLPSDSTFFFSSTEAQSYRVRCALFIAPLTERFPL